MPGETDRRALSQTRQDIPLRDSLSGPQEQVAGLGRAAANHDLVRIERIDRVSYADSDSLSPDLNDPRRRLIAIVSGFDDIGPEDRLAFRLHATEGGLRIGFGDLSRRPIQRVTRRDVLERSRLRKAARRWHLGSDVEAYDRVSELTRATGCAAVDAPT
jgi:hypothetical protein